MLPDRVSNPGPLTYESGALPIALRGPAKGMLAPSQIIGGGGGGLASLFLRLCIQNLSHFFPQIIGLIITIQKQVNFGYFR